jgi:hypothetical protein
MVEIELLWNENASAVELTPLAARIEYGRVRQLSAFSALGPEEIFPGSPAESKSRLLEFVH